MEHPRIEVCAVGPDDRAQLLIDSNLGKKVGIVQGFEDSFERDLCLDVEFPLRSVIEAKTDDDAPGAGTSPGRRLLRAPPLGSAESASPTRPYPSGGGDATRRVGRND